MVVFNISFMKWYVILVLVSFSICLLSCIYHFFKIIRLGKPVDFSEPIGDVGSAVAYSFTGGMSPNKKESAYLHKPTYTAGLIYHAGTFLSIALFFCFLFNIYFSEIIDTILSGFLVISGLCGIGIFIKRLAKKELKSISNPDDYISNFLVTVFQLITAFSLIFPNPVYYILTSILFLYLPLGKLKHTIYFFAARYHLGLFYGKRAVWPPKH
jgi:hypothetical protein